MNKCFDQVAAFQKLWTDSFANMASVWSQFSPGSPPFDEMRKMRGGMLKVLAETWDEYMRTPHREDAERRARPQTHGSRRNEHRGAGPRHTQSWHP